MDGYKNNTQEHHWIENAIAYLELKNSNYRNKIKRRKNNLDFKRTFTSMIIAVVKLLLIT